MRKKVVVDVDAGSDDAVAILLLLTAESEKDFQIEGITCTHGNTSVDNVCRNVLTTLETINRLDVPVFKGAEGPLVPLKDPNVVLNNFHGDDGFGDVGFPSPSRDVQSENAVVALNRIATENEGITLICLGPLTNIALAIRTYSSFSKCLRELYIMGGNTKGVGNSSVAAEFNFYKDPEAAHIVLNSLNCPVTILPWEPCLNDKFSLEERFGEIGNFPTAHIRLLNDIESSLYRYSKFWNPCDALLAAVFLDEAMVKCSKNLHLTVELHGMYTRGQGIVDHLETKNPNVRVVEEVDIEVFKKLIFKMAAFTP